MASDNEETQHLLCPPFCYVDCKTKHHPIIVEMVNIKRTGTDFFALDKLIKTLMCEETGGLDVNGDIPDPNPEYRLTMLHWAAALGKVELVKWLRREKMYRPKCSGEGYSVLHKMIELLQENKDIAFHEMGNIIKELVAIFWKDNLTVKNKEGNMPLHMCCLPLQDNISKTKQAYYISWIYSIITRFKKTYRYKGDYPKLNCIVNCVNASGDTPVHILARFSKNYNTIQFMLEPVLFNFGLKNNQGMTALDIACSCGNEKISTMLKKMGQESMDYNKPNTETEQPVCQNTRFSQQQTELIRKITRTKSNFGNDRVQSSTSDHDLKISPNHKPNEGCLKLPSSTCSSLHVCTKTSPDSKKGLIKPLQRKVTLSATPIASHEKKEGLKIIISSRSETNLSTSSSVSNQGRSDSRIKPSAKSAELTKVTSTSSAISSVDSFTKMKNLTPVPICNIKRHEKLVDSSHVHQSKGNNSLISQDINVSEKSDRNHSNNLSLPLDSNNQITGKVPEPAIKKKQKVYYAIKGNQIQITDSLGSPVDRISTTPGYVPKNVPIVLRGKNARMKRVASFPVSGNIHQGISQLTKQNLVSHFKRISTENHQSPCSTDTDDDITPSNYLTQSSDCETEIGVPWSRQTFCVIPASKATDFLTSQGLVLKQSIPSTVDTLKSSNSHEEIHMTVKKIPKENTQKSINSESHSKTLSKPNTTMSTIVDKFLNTRYSNKSNFQHVSDMTVSQKSPAITVVSSTSSGCKRKDIFSISSSCNDKDHPIKYIKIEDEDSVEMEVSSADQRAQSNTTCTSPVHSISSEPSTCSIDSDSGNGKGILSYLSMCSENTRHDFLDTLYKDRDTYMDEKDNIEKHYKEVCVKCESNMETFASRNSILKYHLDMVKNLKTEINELTDETTKMKETKNKLEESKYEVDRKLETCEHAISEFKSIVL